MVFNGHTTQYIDSVDEELFGDIQVMYAEGMLGNKGIYDALAPVTAAIFNYFRAEGQAAYKTDSIFPWVNDYFRNPDFEPNPEEQVSANLISYITQAKGFSKERFKNVG
jgi:hypothetical protein